MESNLVEFSSFRGRSQYVICHEDEELFWSECTIRMGYANQVTRTRLLAHEAEPRIRKMIHHFRSRKLPFSWTTTPLSRPLQFGTLLRRSGFVRRTETPGMSLAMSRPPHPPPVSEAYRIERIRDRRTLYDCYLLAQSGFDMPRRYFRFNTDLFEELGKEEASPWRYFACRHHDRTVAMCSLFLGRDSAGIYGLTTLPAYRREGIGTLMTRMLLAEAYATGRCRVVLRSTRMAMNMYMRLGFCLCGVFRDYAWIP